MREIKFRAWFTLENKMVEHENLSLQYDRDEGFTFAFDYLSYYSEEEKKGTLNFVLMQYTGLKDMNGKEIYEGDIVRVMREDYEQHVVCYDIHQAKYKTVPFGAYTANAGNGGWTGYELRGYGEVIGNVFENGELLNDRNDSETN